MMKPKIKILSDEVTDVSWAAWGVQKLTALKQVLKTSFKRYFTPEDDVLVELTHVEGQEYADKVVVRREAVEYWYHITLPTPPGRKVIVTVGNRPPGVTTSWQQSNYQAVSTGDGYYETATYTAFVNGQAVGSVEYRVNYFGGTLGTNTVPDRGWTNFPRSSDYSPRCQNYGAGMVCFTERPAGMSPLSIHSASPSYVWSGSGSPSEGNGVWMLTAWNDSWADPFGAAYFAAVAASEAQSDQKTRVMTEDGQVLGEASYARFYDAGPPSFYYWHNMPPWVSATIDRSVWDGGDTLRLIDSLDTSNFPYLRPADLITLNVPYDAVLDNEQIITTQGKAFCATADLPVDVDLYNARAYAALWPYAMYHPTVPGNTVVLSRTPFPTADIDVLTIKTYTASGISVFNIHAGEARQRQRAFRKTKSDQLSITNDVLRTAKQGHPLYNKTTYDSPIAVTVLVDDQMVGTVITRSVKLSYQTTDEDGNPVTRSETYTGTITFTGMDSGWDAASFVNWYAYTATFEGFPWINEGGKMYAVSYRPPGLSLSAPQLQMTKTIDVSYISHISDTAILPLQLDFWKGSYLSDTSGGAFTEIGQLVNGVVQVDTRNAAPRAQYVDQRALTPFPLFLEWRAKQKVVETNGPVILRFMYDTKLADGETLDIIPLYTWHDELGELGIWPQTIDKWSGYTTPEDEEAESTPSKLKHKLRYVFTVRYNLKADSFTLISKRRVAAQDGSLLEMQFLDGGPNCLVVSRKTVVKGQKTIYKDQMATIAATPLDEPSYMGAYARTKALLAGGKSEPV